MDLAVGLSIVALAVGAAGTIGNRIVSDQSTQRIQAIVGQVHEQACAQKRYIQTSIATSRQFLNDHPQGIPEAGLTKELIEDGIARDEELLDTYDSVRCS